MKRGIFFVGVLALASTSAVADDKVKAAVGGGVGGAIGAVIGEELGDRNGAIVGAGVGAAVGTAIATNDRDRKAPAVETRTVVVVERDGPPAHGRLCPPGQAKKGRC